MALGPSSGFLLAPPFCIRLSFGIRGSTFEIGCLGPPNSFSSLYPKIFRHRGMEIVRHWFGFLVPGLDYGAPKRSCI